MMLPARVLPSNAPPLYDGQQISRVLQEQSGNRQLNDFSYTTEYEQKYPSSLITENKYTGQTPLPQQQQQPPSAREYYQKRPQYRQPWRQQCERAGYAHIPAEAMARNQAAAEYLFSRFRQSESYVKYRNRQCKDEKGNEDQKWPDHLEKAFFQALVTWTPMGRGKLMLKDKQRGRNELIADCIEHLTGEARSRKQVSSHIQVLKPFVEKDPYIMKFLSKDDMRMSHGKHGHSSVYGGGRRMSSHPVVSAPHAARSTLPPLARPMPYTMSKMKNNPDVFEPVEFEMFVQQTFKNPANQHLKDPIRMHTYTHHVEEPRKDDLYLQDWATISRDFPLLASMDSERKLDGNVIVAEASLAFPAESFKGEDGSSLPGIELGISLLCSSRHLPVAPKDRSSQVQCLNTFYENGAIKNFVEKNVVKERQESEVRFEHSERPGCQGVVDAQIKFGSTFWARTLGHLANRLMNTTKDYKDEVAQLIRSTAVVQEIFYVGSEGRYERLAAIHWTFRQSTRSGGVASWRRLVLPKPAALTSLQISSSLPDDFAKVERQDSFFECYPQSVEFSVTQPQQHPTLPALQSPFAYESSAGSALSSATWLTSASDESVGQHQLGGLDLSTDNALDFTGGNINISYDHNFDFNNFDSAAFAFETATGDFMADPALEAYSQSWPDPAINDSFTTQPNSAIDDATFISTRPDFDHHAAMYGHDYTSQYSHYSYTDLPEQHHQDSMAHDQQAYGGARQDLVKDGDALATLADVSYFAGTFGAEGNPIGQGFR